MNATAKKPNAKKVVNKVVTISEWQKNVLNVNKEFKQCLRSTGKAIKLLLASEVLNSKQKIFFKNLQKNDDLYQKFDASVKRNAKNEISVFEVLKAYHRINK